MPLAMHANCHMSVIDTKGVTVDLVAEHMGIHVAQSAAIGQTMVMLPVMLAAALYHCRSQKSIWT